MSSAEFRIDHHVRPFPLTDEYAGVDPKQHLHRMAEPSGHFGQADTGSEHHRDGRVMEVINSDGCKTMPSRSHRLLEALPRLRVVVDRHWLAITVAEESAVDGGPTKLVGSDTTHELRRQRNLPNCATRSMLEPPCLPDVSCLADRLSL